MTFQEYLDLNIKEDYIRVLPDGGVSIGKEEKKYLCSTWEIENALRVLSGHPDYTEKTFQDYGMKEYNYTEGSVGSKLGWRGLITHCLGSNAETGTLTTLATSQTPSVVTVLELYAGYLHKEEPPELLIRDKIDARKKKGYCIEHIMPDKLKQLFPCHKESFEEWLVSSATIKDKAEAAELSGRVEVDLLEIAGTPLFELKGRDSLPAYSSIIKNEKLNGEGEKDGQLKKAFELYFTYYGLFGIWSSYRRI